MCVCVCVCMRLLTCLCGGCEGKEEYREEGNTREEKIILVIIGHDSGKVTRKDSLH